MLVEPIAANSELFLDLSKAVFAHGHRVQFRACGPSMGPTIRDGEAIVVERVFLEQLKKNDVLLYRTPRGVIAHRAVAIRKESGKAPVFLTRGDAVGCVEEVVQEQQVLGKVVAVKRNGHSMDPASSLAKMRYRARSLACSGRHWLRGATLGEIHSARAFLLISVLLAIFPNVARANIKVTAKNSGVASSGNTCTISNFDAGTGSPNLIMIGVAFPNGTINSVTFTSGTVTQVGSTFGPLNNAQVAIYKVSGFTNSSSTTVTVNFSGASGCVVGAVAMSGASTVGTAVTGQCITPLLCGTTASVSGITSPGTGGLIFDVVDADLRSSGGSVTLTTGSTQVVEWNCNDACSSNKLVSAGAVDTPNTSESWTLSSAADWALAAVPISPSSTTEVKVSSFTVTPYAAGNLIELKTGHEVSSLGFNLYHEQNGKRVRLNSSLLAGTALLAGPATSFTAGHSHLWLDKGSAKDGAYYWAEEVDISGEHTLYGPASPRQVAFTENSVGTSPLVGQQRPVVTPEARMLSRVGSTPTATPRIVQARPNQVSESEGAVQYRLAARPAIKFAIDSEGWYRVSEGDLVAAGLDPGTLATTLQLYAEGIEQPMVVHGLPNAGLGAGGSIEFYGTALDTTWSGTRAYWLVWGEGRGQRVQSAGFSREAPLGPASFPFSIEWKPRTVYVAALVNGDTDNFFGPVLSGTEPGTTLEPLTQSLTIAHLAAGSANVEVRLQGASVGSHAVAVQINSYPAGNVTFTDQNSGLADLPIPAGVLQEGTNNVLTLTVQGGPEDVSLVDTVLLTYPHTYAAEGDYLRLTAPAGQIVTVGSFSDPQIQVVDVTDPTDVVAVSGTIEPQQGANYSISVIPPRAGTRTLLAFTRAQAMRPVNIAASHPSSWHAPQPGADMVIISNANFMASLGPLKALRESQSHTVAVIDVADLYDEFNFGEKSPYAIKAFVSATLKHWTVKPKWILLVGDATFDPRNYLGLGDYDFVSTYLVGTALLETASDDWFSDLNNTGLPEVAIGRLPVRTPDEATTIIDKIITHEQSAGAWKRQVLLVAGAGDSSNPFEEYTSAVQSLLPGSISVAKLLAGSDSNPSADLLEALNAGQSLVNYVGHGSDEVWAGGLFDTSQAGTLKNSSQTPFVVDMTCLNGFFQDVYTVALAKALIKAPGGGAVGVWASSGLTSSLPQSILDQAIIRELFSGQSLTVGEAAMIAKKAVSDLDVRRTWILFGDPAMKLF